MPVRTPDCRYIVVRDRLWRALMPAVREVARDLMRARLAGVLQKGEPLSPDTEWRGPIRIRAAR